MSLNARNVSLEPAWGGVYVGPASTFSAAQAQRVPHWFQRYQWRNLSTPARASTSRDQSYQSSRQPRPVVRSKNEASTSSQIETRKFSGKIKCEICKKKCKGDIFKADDKYFHIACFICKTCKKPLSELGYFAHKNEYYCPTDYHSQFGSKCSSCNKYVEGEAVQCMGKTFHQNCFRCDRCRQPFAAGQKATFTAREHLCPKCSSIPVATVKPTQSNLTHNICLYFIKNSGSAAGEPTRVDGLPYCTRLILRSKPQRCHECDNFIAGKVLQADNYYFHPGCALCTRCGQHFGEHEEMYMQGDEIWHARCNEISPPDKVLHRYSTLPLSLSPSRFSDSFSSYNSHSLSFQHSLPRSPRSTLHSPKYSCNFGKFLTYMYLLPQETMPYLKQPIPPHAPHTQQFHVPQDKLVKLKKSRVSMFKSGLQKLAEIMDEMQPRPRSPYMNNEEPIELSHFPSARAPEPHEVPAIEREDFPAPPYPYAVEELKRRLSSSDLENDEEDVVDGNVQKIKKAEEELIKIENESSIAKVFVQNLEAKIKKTKSPLFYDPRSASRTPSAKKLPHLKCRYESPINASPSRYLSRPRPWEYWEKNRAVTATIPYPYYLQVPKPGYGLAPKAASLPGSYGVYYQDYHLICDLDTTRSSTLSDKSNVQTPVYSEYVDRFQPSYGAGLIRTSLPDMSKPPKRHLSKDEFEKIFRMMPIEFYRLPEWKRIQLKRTYRLY
uniref:Uncharacterized protein n=1 Tax=Romanomermis culicivorax TaxID=13658 RepID=A0A915HRK2_ROMCU